MIRTIQGSADRYFFQVANVQSGGSWCVWTAVLTVSFGVIAFWAKQSWLLPFFLPAAYLTLALVLVRTLRTWRDPLNPLCLVLIIGLVRFLVPGFLIMNGAELEGEFKDLIDAMRISDTDWQWANVLALIGMLSVVLGWLSIQKPSERQKHLKFYVSETVKYASIIGMVIGGLAIFAFIVMNASLGVIVSGGFRSATIEVGTGKYFFLAYLLISGCVLLSCYFLARGRTRISMVPPFIAALLYWGLGGRNRAMAPIAGGLLLLWYYGRETKSWKKVTLTPKYVALAIVIPVCVVWLSYVGLLYRGESGVGLSAFSEALSISGFSQHVKQSIFSDLGQLQGLAGAIAIGPGVLRGDTFIGALSWPLSKVISVPGRSAGVFIVEELVGFGSDQPRWGFNASLIGDAYLNFGFGAVVVITLLFGALIKLLYVKFRSGDLHCAIYTLAVVSAVQAFWVSIEVWPQALTVIGFAVSLLFFGSTILRVKSGQA